MQSSDKRNPHPVPPLSEGEGELKFMLMTARASRARTMFRLLRSSSFRARSLRRRSTPAEEALWTPMRDREVEGAKFRRQHPIGPFFVDFYCHEARLVVEADGAPHFPPPSGQATRDARLRTWGLEVVRFENSEIIEDGERVLDTLRLILRSRLPPPLPPGEGAGR